MITYYEIESRAGNGEFDVIADCYSLEEARQYIKKAKKEDKLNKEAYSYRIMARIRVEVY